MGHLYPNANDGSSHDINFIIDFLGFGAITGSDFSYLHSNVEVEPPPDVWNYQPANQILNYVF